MQAKQKPLMLVDGSSYLYRAFHALPPLTNSKGFPTGAIYGMVSMLNRLIADHEPEEMAVIFDAKGKTFRDELYADYKATRKETPSELIQQIAPIHQIILAMGLPLLVVEGVEADDVIATLARNATQHGQFTLIATSDKDLAQLVSPHIHLVNTMTNVILDEAGVKAKFGVPPSGIIDYLTLVGDTSDNIPGIPQVGPKTAVKWLETYHSVAGLIEHADDIKGKVGETLRAHLKDLDWMRQLVTVKDDVSLPIQVNELKRKPADTEALIALYKELEFKGWLSALLAQTPDHHQTERKQYVTIDTEEKLATWIADLKKSKYFAVDTETTSLDYIEAKLVGLSFALPGWKAAYLPVGHDYVNAPPQLDKKAVLAQLKPLLENENIQKIGQNLKYDAEILANEGITLRGITFDTMIESYVLDSTSNNYDLDSLALKYLGWRTITFEEVAGKGAKQITFNHVSVEKAAEYAAEDADVTLRLHDALWPRLEKEKGLKQIFTDIEMPLVPVLATMERHGVLIDPHVLKAQEKTMQARLATLEKSIFAISGTPFNLNSPKQLQEILFQTLKLPILQKTPTGQPSTADAVLQELAMDFEIPALIIEYRSLSKLISTYTTRLVEQISPKTNRIHTSYHQTGTATGRLSSSDPNLQNIPIRTEEGKRIREAFIAPPGYQLLSADYSQIELRLMAHMSDDTGLIQAFLNGMDIHRATAAEVWGVAPDDVTPDMRRHAKAINFGLIYGMSAFGLTRQLNISRQEAEEYIERYFKRYPRVREYMESTRESAKARGFVETVWGRRLYLPEIQASQMMRRKAAERAAINAPLQGSAADIIKLAMIHIDKELAKHTLDAYMIMQVHDELVFEVKAEQIPAATEMIQRLMTNCVSLKVPILVAVGTGNNWNEASEHDTA